jgi:hypothetical protein
MVPIGIVGMATPKPLVDEDGQTVSIAQAEGDVECGVLMGPHGMVHPVQNKATRRVQFPMREDPKTF